MAKRFRIAVVLAFSTACRLSAGPAEEPPASGEAFTERVVVTASRGEEAVSDTAAAVTVLTREDLEGGAALTLDDRLRQVPAFSLLRRSGSLSANPTSQGVSLRGLAPSGTSRSLVLFDGVPLNDPFGGWVYWNRLPGLALSSVEVVRGALSQLYGSAALSGVVQLLPRRPEPGLGEVLVRGGERGTGDLEAFAGHAGERLGWTAAARSLRTDGFYLLRPGDRGAVDRRTDLELLAGYGRLTAGPFHAGLQAYTEERGNGTALQRNDTRITLLEAGFARGPWEAGAYGQEQRFQSTFSRILPDRSAEVLTARQDVAAHAAGGALVWRPGSGTVAGGDVRRVSWEGRGQTLSGLFAQRTVALSPRLDVVAGARLDAWQGEGTRWSLNPRLGAAFRATGSVLLRASAYRGFRAPTLNELYRPFRVGNVETAANPELDEETVVGGEAGFEIVRPRGDLRLDAFWNRLDGAVGNATVSVTPELILRRRQNLGVTTVRGLEAAGSFRASPRWTLRAAALRHETEVAETGRRLPQVPRHQGSFGVSYRGRWRAELAGRWAGEQFEDDRNELPLPGFVAFDLAARHPLGADWEVGATVENLLDREIVTGRLPQPTLGTPRTFLLLLAWRAPSPRAPGPPAGH